ncbi:MAG: PAS domain S-box protein [Isosphaeraceae bacterium]
MRLLLVDDNAEDRLLAIRVLRRDIPKLDVNEIGDAEGFRRALERDGFEAAVTDYRLHWSDGIAVLEALRSRYPDLPVVMFTSSGSEEIAVDAMKAGLDDYVLKSPGHLSRLPAAVMAAVKRVQDRRRMADLESLVNRLNVGIYRIAADGRLIEANPAFLRLLGFSSIEEARQAWPTVLAGRHPRPGETPAAAHEMRIERPDGSTSWLLLSETATFADGETVVDGLAEDITQRKAEEEAQFRLASIVESSDDAIIGKTLDGVIASWNAGAERIFGYSAAEAIGQHINLLVPPGQRDEIPSILERIRRGESIGHYETRRRRKDGTILDVSLSVSPIRDDAGRVIGASKIARDVSQRKQTERELARLNQELQDRIGELQTLLEILPVGVWIGDAESRRIVGNRAANEMLGLSPGTNVSPSAHDPGESGRPGFRYLREGKEIPVNELPMRRAIATRQVVKNFEEDVVFEDGRVVTLQGSAAPLFDERGEVRGAVAACADVTERKRAEEALRAADRRKNEFLAMLGHELRNPLGPIRNAVQILNLVGSKEPDARAACAMIERQVAHMARLIDDLLDVSRIVRGKIQLRREQCDLARIAREAAADNRAEIEAAGLTFRVEISEGSVWMTGDPTRINQVLGNILNNAHKFTDPGGLVTLRLAVEPGGDFAEITVRDTGIGIEPEILDRIFEPFSQADSSLDRARGGLGLGLALVKGLVELHGGEARAASAGAGHGTEFTIRLPLRTAEASAPPAIPTRTAPRPARVLIVEDNIDAAHSLHLLLRMSGHEVVVAHDARQALNAIDSFRAELVLCDLGLPGDLNGYDLARILRRKPETSASSLVALSGYGREEDRRRAREAGFDLHLTKPVDFVRLREIIADPPRSRRGD